MGLGQVVRAISKVFEGEAAAISLDDTRYLFPIDRNEFVMFQNAFKSNAKNTTSQIMHDGDSFYSTEWADNGWASSMIFGSHSRPIVTFSKWVNIDNKDYQIQTEWVINGPFENYYAINLYDGDGNLLTFIDHAYRRDLLGSCEDRAALRIMRSAFLAAVDHDISIVVYKPGMPVDLSLARL